MAFFSDLAQHLEMLRDAFGGEIEPDQLPVVLERLDDDDVVAVLTSATALVRVGEKVRIAASGVAAARSTSEAGHEGLAQKRGHRSPASLIQEITGASRTEAAKHVRLGETLRTAAGLQDAGEEAKDAAVSPETWHAPLSRALLAGTIGSAQHDAILRGLGEPPSPEEAEAWSAAAEQLVAEARERTVEELARTSRTVRDQLDPEGAQRRFDERFDGRSFRAWTDADGIRRGSIVFDDFGGAWVQGALDSALRPRRGGPRFVDPEKSARADELVVDPRTDDQLAYDLLIDVLRAGALADAESVFGTRQAGVRVLIAQPSLEAVGRGDAAVGLLEDDQVALPGWLVGQLICETGTMECSLDTQGNPLDLGREARLYAPKQRIALAIRDGGCRWRGCDRPASFCEAHHIDQWSADQGRTDIDRGILLCRWHHMALHHGGWRITREGKGDFVLHPPPGRGEPIALTTRLALRYVWPDVGPPPTRFRPAA